MTDAWRGDSTTDKMRVNMKRKVTQNQGRENGRDAA